MGILSSRFVVAVAFCAVFAVGIALADTNLALNPSFEILPAGTLTHDSCGTGCFYSIVSDGPTFAIPSWTTIGSDIGQFQPGPPATTTYFSSVPEGSTIAYSNGGTISQFVGNIQLGDVGQIYTLAVDVGNRADGTPPGQYANQGSVDLNINGNQISATGPQAPLGGWSVWTVTYTVQSTDVGHPITIELNANAPQGDYDNVVLTESPTPEPGFYGILALGLSSLAFVRRRKKTQNG